MKIDAATFADIEALLAIETAAHKHPWPQSEFEKELGLPQSQTLVARQGSEIAGYIVSWLVADRLEILNVCTAPLWQRRGVARRLLQTALSRGGESAILEVRAGNTPAIALYESFGFARTGKRRAYYPDGEDAILYTLATKPPPGA